LGLTLVRDLLVLLDGEIELESEVGLGTRVTFRLPVSVIG
jgi:signal transduction histidine kinase